MVARSPDARQPRQTAAAAAAAAALNPALVRETLKKVSDGFGGDGETHGGEGSS